MATYKHGKGATFLFATLNLSPWINEASGSQSLEPADTSHFGEDAKTYITGQDDGTITFSGLHDGTVGAIKDVLSAAITDGANRAITFAPEGLSVGAYALMGLAKETSYETTAVVSDVVKVTGGSQVDGGLSHGNILSDATPFSTTLTGAAVDNTVATTLGGRAFLHVTENATTGTVVAKVQHSSDNSVWVDLATFTTVPTLTTASEAITFAGTVNRYLRVLITLGGTGNVVAPVSVARN